MRALSATLRRWRARARWTTAERADFYELLAGFAGDGLPVFEALTEMDQQYRRFGDPLEVLTRQLLGRMRGAGGPARPLGTALEGWVPVVEALAVRSGEDAGDVAGGLQRAAQIARAHERILGAIRGELAYPAFLLLLFGVLMVGLATHVVPTMAEILSEDRWPPSARAVASLARGTPWLLGAAVGLGGAGVAGFVWSRSRWTGPLRSWADQWIFPFTLHRRTTGALLLASLAALLRIGIPFSQALERIAEGSGPWERAHVARIRGRLRRGEREGVALAGPLFDVELRWQLELYGRLSRFSEALESFSARALAKTEARIRASFGALRTLLLVGIAGMILWVYSAFMAITLAARAAG